jgi:hypothetical protein
VSTSYYGGGKNGGRHRRRILRPSHFRQPHSYIQCRYKYTQQDRTARNHTLLSVNCCLMWTIRSSWLDNLSKGQNVALDQQERLPNEIVGPLRRRKDRRNVAMLQRNTDLVKFAYACRMCSESSHASRIVFHGMSVGAVSTEPLQRREALRNSKHTPPSLG